MESTRRDFLTKSAAVAGAGFIHGFNRCFEQDSRPATRPSITKPDALARAIEAAVRDFKPCIIIEMPVAAAQKQQLGLALLKYIYNTDNDGKFLGNYKEFPDFEMHALFAEAVFILLTKTEVAAAVPEAKSGNVHILGARGEWERSAEIPTADLLVKESFKLSIRELLHGKDNEILIKRAAECEARVTPGLRRAMQQFIEGRPPENFPKRFADESLSVLLTSPTSWNLDRSVEVRFKGRSPEAWLRAANVATTDEQIKIFKESLGSQIPWLLNQARIGNVNTKFIIGAMLEYYLCATNKDSVGAWLPYGLSLGSRTGRMNGCGGLTPDGEERRAACGMGSPGPASRQFINYIR